MDNINEIFKCSICYEVIEDQIYQCENGHLCCNICINNINHCGTCRCSNYKIRNILLENIRDKLKEMKNINNNIADSTTNNNILQKKIFKNIYSNYSNMILNYPNY
jgi:hypothetical protein